MAGDAPPRPAADVISSGGDRPGRHRRWPWLVLAVVLLGAAVAQPVRDHLAGVQARHLQQVWWRALALDMGRRTAESRLAAAAAPTDARLSMRASAAVKRQEAARLRRLRDEIGHGWARDPAVDRLADAMRAALAGEAADLRHPTGVWSETTHASVLLVARLLAAQRDRFDLPVAGPPGSARLTAAHAALRRLRPYLDEPLPLRLLVASEGEPEILDLSTGRAARAPPPVAFGGGGPYPVAVRRHGYLAVLAGQTVYAARLTLDGRFRRLGRGWLLFPAVRPDAVWIAAGQRVRLVDGRGRTLYGPVATPRGWQLTGLAVPGGLLLAHFVGTARPTGLRVWDPRGREAVRVIARGCAYPVAARANLIAWVSCRPRGPLLHTALHLTDVRTGAERVLANPPGVVPQATEGAFGVGAFSPDGRWLAAYYWHRSYGSLGPAALGLVDTRSGRVRLLHGAPVGHPPYQLGPAVIWTTNSTRLFFQTGVDGGIESAGYDASVPFATFRIGDLTSVDLRYHQAQASLLAVLPPG